MPADRFDLIDLRLFRHVHEAGSITAGAARSHMTLASASARVRALEDALGTPLLLRDRQPAMRLCISRMKRDHGRRC